MRLRQGGMKRTGCGRCQPGRLACQEVDICFMAGYMLQINTARAGLMNRVCAMLVDDEAEIPSILAKRLTRRGL
jgi:hypothetical protein